MDLTGDGSAEVLVASYAGGEVAVFAVANDGVDWAGVYLTK